MNGTTEKEEYVDADREGWIVDDGSYRWYCLFVVCIVLDL